MTSKDQQIQIHQYLLSKRLPIDILLEVQDHFQTQIEGHIQELNISFAEAFSLTQITWQKDFKLVQKSFLSFGKVPRIVKAIQSEVSEKMIKKSIFIAIAVFFFQLLSAKLMMKDYYFMIHGVLYVLMGISILVLILVYIFSSITKQRTRAERYFYNQLLNIFLWYIVLAMFGVFTKLPTNSLKIIYDFVHGINEFSVEYFIAAGISMIFKTAVTIYFYLMLKDRAKSIHDIKNYNFSRLNLTKSGK